LVSHHKLTQTDLVKQKKKIAQEVLPVTAVINLYKESPYMFMQLLICHPKEQIIRVTVAIPEIPERHESMGWGAGSIGGNVPLLFITNIPLACIVMVNKE